MSQLQKNTLPLDTDTIAAESTPRGRGGISIIRISGKNARAIAAELHPKIATQTPRKPILRQLTHQGQWLDEALVTLYQAPASYTGEDSVELATHGNPLIVEKILHALTQAGARPAQPGEFTRRAYLNARIPLTRAEAVAQLIHAGSEAALRSAKNLYGGGLEIRLNNIRATLISLLAEIEALIDFVEEGIETKEQTQLTALAQHTQQEITRLLQAIHQGRISQNGIIIVLAGLPNAGKSSLLNALCHRQRAIVSPTPGTTRDTIETSVEWSGYQVRLSDTAGLRHTTDPIETEGVNRTREALATADIILWVTDASQPPPPALLQEIANHATPGILVLNKTDLLTNRDITKCHTPYQEALAEKNLPAANVSALNNTGIEELRNQVIRQITGNTSPDTEAINIHESHRSALEQAAAHITLAQDALTKGIGLELAAIDLREAIGHIASISTPVTNEDLLGDIFSKFCIGK